VTGITPGRRFGGKASPQLKEATMDRRATAIEAVRQGMVVVDSAGERIGTVEMVQMGDPEAVTTQGNEHPSTGLIGAMVDAVAGTEPDVPEPLRSRLLRTGYLKIDGPGLTDTDRYARADRIAAVTGDTVRLAVRRDQLATEA
jgi:hypothetical protein